MFEKKSEKPISNKAFALRMLRFLMYSVLILGISLCIGMAGYHTYAHLAWIDAFYNASMILTGMGPVDKMPDTSAKIFSGCYALYSGIAFLSTIAVLFAPMVHRLLHLMHLDEE